MLLVIVSLAVQAAQVPAPPAPAPNAGTTVMERVDDRDETPLASRIARPVSQNFAPDPVAALYLREWGDCVVMMNRPRTLALLETPLNSAEQARIINQLTGHRFTRRTPCARFRSMRVDNLVLRGAIAESLYRWEERRQRSAGPLSAARPLEGAGRPAQVAQVAHCLVERDLAAAERVMATRPGTSASRQALAGIAQRIDGCLPSGLRARDIHPLTLRGALGEAYYLRKRSLDGHSLSSAG